MIVISQGISIHENEIELTPIRAQGAGGQNVNKVSSAIHLRFNIGASSLPEFYKRNLLAINDHRISKEGVLIIKAQSHRTQEKNRQDAINRLQQLIKTAGHRTKYRKPTKPSKGSQKKRLDRKSMRGKTKALRRNNFDFE